MVVATPYVSPNWGGKGKKKNFMGRGEKPVKMLVKEGD